MAVCNITTVERHTMFKALIVYFSAIGLVLTAQTHAAELSIQPNSRIVLVGNGLGSRMMEYGHFETGLHQRYPTHKLFIRNMCDEGNTPGYRPHSARPSPWAYPGAENFRTLAQSKDRWAGTGPQGSYQSPDEWLHQLKPDIIIAFFGFNESFDGPEELPRFKSELEGFVNHSLSQSYNGQSPAQLALVSPIAFQNLSALYNTPDGVSENANLALYTQAMQEVATRHDLHFVDLFSPTLALFKQSDKPLTRDGALLTDEGYAVISPLLTDGLFGKQKPVSNIPYTKLREAVLAKNWFWQNYYKIPNGVHVFGRRHRPFGPMNYPEELTKLEQMVAVRDRAVWALLAGDDFDVAAEDAKTAPLSDITSNRKSVPPYLAPEEAVKQLTVPEGYKIDLFADEARFPHLANPVQLSFDNKGRLWVATMPSYPHYKPGDPLPADKLLILEDTDGDHVADKETVFADDLHLPMGFEFTHEGVYVSQGINLVLLKDTDGDDHYDVREVVLRGFDDHDTHHAISAFCADPSGAIMMGEGTFLHSHVETAYGPIRSSNGGFFRYNPARRQLERTARISIPNPWGIAFDHWGQDFFADTSGPEVRWMLQGSVRVGFGNFAPRPPNLLAVRVRPTSGLEFISSRHFPDAVQGDLLINNNIGFQGTKQHTMSDNGTGFVSTFRHDLVKSSDPNFRPVDMEFAPDGSLYLVDWHNALIGHMQHSARDPFRDHSHGRIYRITYPARPLVKPAQIAGAPLDTLFKNLELPEYRTRYRTRREIRGRERKDVMKAMQAWITGLDKLDPSYDHNLLEALWVSWGMNEIDPGLINQLLASKDYRARAAAVRAIRYNTHQLSNYLDLLVQAAGDPHGRVVLETIVAASWLPSSEGLKVLDSIPKSTETVSSDSTFDSWVQPVFDAANAYLRGQDIKGDADPEYKTNLTGADLKAFHRGAAVYGRDGHCGTCHQPDGNGLPDAQFPPLAGSEWVAGSEERLIKLALHGLYGPITVKGKDFPGSVPMTPFKFLSDQELADVLTFVRNAFGNTASVVNADSVKKVRGATADRETFYSPEELLKEHPHEPLN
jgi:mono/diheme cytochrome c family protein/glucose/arabinose dehydrogenase